MAHNGAPLAYLVYYRQRWKVTKYYALWVGTCAVRRVKKEQVYNMRKIKLSSSYVAVCKQFSLAPVPSSI